VERILEIIETLLAVAISLALALMFGVVSAWITAAVIKWWPL
jgi:hypothetical protein